MYLLTVMLLLASAPLWAQTAAGQPAARVDAGHQAPAAEPGEFKHWMQGAVSRPLAAKAADQVSVKDWGAAGDGIADDTLAIQKALNAAFALRLGTVPDDFGQRHAGAATVFFPAGKYRTTATLETYQNIRIVGAGRYSTLIASSSSGPILRNAMPGTEYGPSGLSIEHLSVVGDRSKASQVGIALLRAYKARLMDLSIQSCGSHGLVYLQCVNGQLDNVDTHLNAGSGLVCDQGVASWTDPSPTNLPTIGCVFNNLHAGFNDSCGILLKGFHSANIFYGGSSEQNQQRADRPGYQVVASGVCDVPDEFNDFYTEAARGLAHVLVDMSDIGNPIRFSHWHHYGQGSLGKLDRALIVARGTVFLDRPIANTNGYRTLGASSAPFRLTKVSARIFLWDPYGCSIHDGRWVEDETGATTGLDANLRYTESQFRYGPNLHRTDFGDETQQWQVASEPYPWAALENFYRSLTLSGGQADKAAIGARLQWLGPRAMGVADGHRMITGWLSADRGDASVTLTVGTDRAIQRFGTALTAHRRIALSPQGALNGDHFRIVRTGLGPFTLDVGGLKTIPAATAAFVDVCFDGKAWQLVGYGAL